VGFLDILGGLNVILLQELLDDLAFSLGHLDFMDGFLLSFCHHKRPPREIVYITGDPEGIIQFVFTEKLSYSQRD